MGRFGSGADENPIPRLRLLLRVKPTLEVRFFEPIITGLGNFCLGKLRSEWVLRRRCPVLGETGRNLSGAVRTVHSHERTFSTPTAIAFPRL